MSSAEELKGIPCRQRGKSRTRKGGKRRVLKSEQVLPPTNGGGREHGLGAGRGSSLSLPPVDSKSNKDRDTVGGFLPCNAVFGGCQKSEKLCEHKHKSCHSFMTKSPTGARSRIHSTMIQRHRYAPPKALPKSQKKRWSRRDRRIAALKEFTACDEHAIKVTNSRTYFIGNDNVANHWPDDAKHISVSRLRIIDTIRGARISDVCTLPPQKGLRTFKSPAVFKYLQDLERFSPFSKTETARGKSKIPFSDTKSKYVYLGSTALQGGPGVVDSLKSMDKGKRKAAWDGISKFFRAVEDFSLPYMESAEVYGRHQAKQMLGYKTFPLSNKQRS